MLRSGMFERFTDAARRVLVLAQEEARLLNHNFIGTEHVLLGMLREGEGVAAQALTALDISLSDARAKVEAAIGSATTSVGSPPFTPRVKKVLELSLREALQLGHTYIGTEHILLGIAREGEGLAAQILVASGADLARVRQEVIRLLPGPGGTSRGAQPEASAATPLNSGPRCNWCRAELSESARYRIIAVPPDELESEEGAVRATVLYCSRCGTLLSPAAGTHTRTEAGPEASAEVRPKTSTRTEAGPDASTEVRPKASTETSDEAGTEGEPTEPRPGP
ncbi:MAG TPA: Clp protease N-terminal domain-containing protein [Acidimicrobiales bacterium]|nr:Clp protease N-terminal domain-containing protein [Acidimicrobiales bacterium]